MYDSNTYLGAWMFFLLCFQSLFMLDMIPASVWDVLLDDHISWYFVNSI